MVAKENKVELASQQAGEGRLALHLLSPAQAHRCSMASAHLWKPLQSIHSYGESLAPSPEGKNTNFPLPLCAFQEPDSCLGKRNPYLRGKQGSSFIKCWDQHLSLHEDL